MGLFFLCLRVTIPFTMDMKEQKTLFAERYMRRPNDALMIVANILGTTATDNPMLAITYANEWPNDSFVLSEIKRLKTIAPTLRDRVIQLEELVKECMLRGEEKAAVEYMKLIMQAEGHLKAKDDGGKSDDRLKELAAMILDDDKVDNNG